MNKDMWEKGKAFKFKDKEEILYVEPKGKDVVEYDCECVDMITGKEFNKTIKVDKLKNDKFRR